LLGRLRMLKLRSEITTMQPPFELFRLLADQGDATTQNRLGQMYEVGQSVPNNYSLLVNVVTDATISQDLF
jgi:TPR repeat protein